MRNAETDGWRGSVWRKAAWSIAVLIVLLPLVAMRFTDEVDWTLTDFVVAGVLVFSPGIAFELAVRKTRDVAYRMAVAVAVAVAVAFASSFLLAWLSVGVGIIGKEGDPANLMYFGVLAVGIIGGFIARFEPQGLAVALIATALAQALVGAIALVAKLGHPWSGPMELLVLNGFFVAMFLAPALLFRKAASGVRPVN